MNRPSWCAVHGPQLPWVMTTQRGHAALASQTSLVCFICGLSSFTMNYVRSELSPWSMQSQEITGIGNKRPIGRLTDALSPVSKGGDCWKLDPWITAEQPLKRKFIREEERRGEDEFCPEASMGWAANPKSMQLLLEASLKPPGRIGSLIGQPAYWVTHSQCVVDLRS